MTTDLALVEKPTGPTVPPKPTTSQKVNTAGALTLLTIAISGLAYTANTDPDYVFVAMGAAWVAIVIAAVTLLRTAPRTV